jgi:hypothetical protein
MYQNFTIPYSYEAQHVSGDTPPNIRSLQLQWKVVGRVVGGPCQAHYAWQRPTTTRPTTFHVWKTRGCQCSFKLLMMGGVSPETCWASYKYGIINVWYTVAPCWIFLYELYYDARIHEHQVHIILQHFSTHFITGEIIAEMNLVSWRHYTLILWDRHLQWNFRTPTFINKIL